VESLSALVEHSDGRIELLYYTDSPLLKQVPLLAEELKLASGNSTAEGFGMISGVSEK